MGSKSTIFPLFFLAALGGIAYSNSLETPFIFDDYALVHNQNIRSLWPLTQIFEVSHSYHKLPVRPLVTFSFALNYAWGEYEVFGYHLVNVVIHILASWTLFLILKTTFKRFSPHFQKNSSLLSLVISAIWLAHPLQTESVTYITQRSQCLSGFFYFLSFYFSIKAFTSEKKRWFISSCLICFLGALSKSVVATLPIAIILYDRIFFYSTFNLALQKRWKFYLSLMCSWFVTLCLLFLHIERHPDVGLASSWSYFLTQTEIFVHYFKLSFYPKSLCFDYGWPLVTSLKEVIFPFCFTIFILFLTIWGCLKNKKISFLGIWFFVTIAVTSSIFSLPDPACERYLYLPLASLITFFVLSLNYLLMHILKLKHQIFHVIFYSALIIPFCLQTFERNKLYASNSLMWEDVVNKRPDHYRGHLNLGICYVYESKLQQAHKHLTRAIALKPNNPTGYSKLGLLYRKMNQHEKAIESYRLSLKIDSTDPHVYYELAVSLEALHKLAEAIESLRKAIKLDSRESHYHKSLAYFYSKANKPDLAIQSYRQALRLSPKDDESYVNLGNVYQAIGQPDDAIRSYRQALHHNPQNDLAHYNLGLTYQALGKQKKAREQFQKTLSLNPQHQGAQQQLEFAGDKW